MNEWWSQLAPRERLLIALGGGLALILGIVQFVLLPSFSYRDQAAQALAAEQALNADVRAAAAPTTAEREVSSRNLPLQAVISDTANVFGLGVSRMTPSEDGLTLWLEAEPPAALYAWLVDLERRHAVRVGKASIRWNQDKTTVSANLFVSREL